MTPRSAPAGRRRGRSWDTVRPARRFQQLWVSLGVLCLLPGLVATTLRLLPPEDDVPALLAAFVPYGVLAYLAALGLFLVALVRARRHLVLALLAGLSALLLTVHISWLAPYFVPDHRPAVGGSFSVLSLNIHEGTADPAQMVQAAQQADVVVFVEATYGAMDLLRPYGWHRRFPYSVRSDPGAESGTAIYSRYPLTGTSHLDDPPYQQWSTSVQVPRLGPVRLIAAHPCNPYCGGGRFAIEHADLRATADAAMGAPLVIAGDFNAVDDHGPMQALYRDGMESATDIVGAGWLPTYPSNSWLPPLLPIDHVLVNRFLTATSISSVRVAGTDHRGLLARIARTDAAPR